MVPYHPIDVLDEPSGLSGSIGKSFLVHALIAGSLIGWAMWKGPLEPGLGSPDAAGGAIGIGVVDSIPLPQSSTRPNPVADDSDSQAPREKEKEIKEEKDKDALEKLLERDLKPTSTKKKSSASEKQEVAENKLRSAESQVGSPLIGKPGIGGISAGSSAFGNQFGGYVETLQQKIASKWRASDLDPRLKNSPLCIVAFEIQRDGRTSSPRIVQSSGSQELDLSALRAVTEASPFEPLPQGYQSSSAKMEVGFKLQR